MIPLDNTPNVLYSSPLPPPSSPRACPLRLLTFYHPSCDCDGNGDGFLHSPSVGVHPKEVGHKETALPRRGAGMTVLAGLFGRHKRVLLLLLCDSLWTMQGS